MTIHECGRCDGCGYITGGFQWEVPWTRWAPTTDHPNTQSFLRPHACPDCGGTGALLEMPATTPRLEFASRRGLAANTYADHVALILQTRMMRTLN
jgi:hypothetical protein